MLDYLIVGQGLAGSWLSHYLIAAGQRVCVVDKYQPSSASRIASGIMNPVTGKRLVKTWQADTVLPFAHQAYRHVEELLNTPFFDIKPIIWLLHQVETLNQFSALSAEPDYLQYIVDVVARPFAADLQTHLGYAIIHAGHVQTDVFLSTYRQYLQRHDALLDEIFTHADLQLNGQSAPVEWRGIAARHLIFCEGIDILAQNPYFNWLPFTPAKGEVLHVRLPKVSWDKFIIKNGLFILHLYDDIFWVGSNYEHHFLDNLPNPEVRKQLLEQLDDTLKCPYEVVHHVAAIRPASHYRRPFVGTHPQYRQLSVLNGLGTKGVSLAPYYAAQLAGHLLHQTPLDKAVQIDTFFR